MDERRRKNRTDLDAHLVIKNMDGSKIDGVAIDVTNVSTSGIGFMCKEDLEMGSVYEGTLTIWTKEKIKVFLEIVRRLDVDDRINYGAHFVGMPDLYARKIAVYQTVEEENKKKSDNYSE